MRLCPGPPTASMYVQDRHRGLHDPSLTPARRTSGLSQEHQSKPNGEASSEGTVLPTPTDHKVTSVAVQPLVQPSRATAAGGSGYRRRVAQVSGSDRRRPTSRVDFAKRGSVTGA